MNYRGVQKNSEMEEFPSKRWGVHASFLHTLSTGKADASGKGPAGH